MRHILLGLCLFGATSWAIRPYEIPRDPDPYYGKDSSEAVLTFDHHVSFESDTAPTADETNEEIEDQILDIFGPMGVAGVRAVPKTDHEITNVDLKKVSEKQYQASYHYSGHILIQNGLDGDYSITIPVDPDKIFEASVVTYQDAATGQPVKTFPCITDAQHHDEEDFFYFWDARLSGCPLQLGRDYEVIPAHVERLKNDVTTYPEYSRLVDANGTIRTDIFFGMDDGKKDHNPWVSQDVSAQNFIDVYNRLKQWGFTERLWTTEEIQKVSGTAQELPPYVIELSRQDISAKMVIRLVFGPTAKDEESQAFHYFFKDALENASVMIYSGHSGLGDYLDLDGIEKKRQFKLAPNKERYQIYFFNSCSSYPYYTDMYFDRKKSPTDPKGTKNLDILTNGLVTYFHIDHDTTLELISAVGTWAAHERSVSYQEMVNVIDSNNLMGVNGDEDNPTVPEF